MAAANCLCQASSCGSAAAPPEALNRHLAATTGRSHGVARAPELRLSLAWLPSTWMRATALEPRQHHRKKPGTVACSCNGSQVLEMPGLFLLGPRPARVGMPCIGSSLEWKREGPWAQSKPLGFPCTIHPAHGLVPHYLSGPQDQTSLTPLFQRV